MDNDVTEQRFALARKTSFVLLAFTLFIYALVSIRNFLYPIAFGIVLGYLLYPLASWFERKGFPRILANLIIIFGALGVLIGLFMSAYAIITPLGMNVGELGDKAVDNLSEMSGRIGTAVGLDQDETRQIIRDQAATFFESGGEKLSDFFSATTSTLVAFGLLPVYTFLFLYYRTKFMYFWLKVAGRSRRMKTVTILREISQVMVRYLSGVIVVVFILCIINSLGLVIIGMEFAIPLGVAAAFFNFIPYFGTLLGGLVPLVFAFLVEGNFSMVFRVLILFVIIQFIENNILTPNIVGGNVNLNPFFIITGLVASSMIWGVPGMLLIVPVLASTKILFSHVSFMKPYAFLLGEEGTSKHSIQLSKIKRLWKHHILRKQD